MQQRRGTAQQWTDADPILAAGEIGFETDTNQFKIGDGVNHWEDLSYFKNLEDLGANLDDYILLTEKAVANGVATLDATGQIPVAQLGNIIDGAPGLLDTLNELADAIDNNDTFANTMVTALSTKAPLASPNLSGTPTAPTPVIGSNTNQIATTAFVKAQEYALNADLSIVGVDLDTAEGEIDTLQQDVTTAQGEIDVLQGDVTTAQNNITSIQSDVSSLQSDVSGLQSDLSVVEGQINTATTGLTARVTTAEGEIDTLQGNVTTAQGNITSIQSDVSGLQSDLSVVEGQINTATTGLTDRVATAETDIQALETTVNTATTGLVARVTTAEGEIDTLQGDLDTAEASLSTLTGNHNTHGSATTSVHGIADTSALATKTYADGSAGNAQTAAQSYADTGLALKASLASPALTGTPTAPTAAAATNTTQIATTAFVKTAIDNVVASAPGALDTLSELATALGSDANFSTTVTNSLATKAPTASPTFTGTVALPATSSVTFGGTALSSTLSDKADKTASISVKYGGYTFTSENVNMICEYNSGSAGTFTIPSDNSFWTTGQRLEVIQTGAGQLTIAGGSGVTVNGTPTTKTRTQYSGATIIKRSANVFIVLGDLASS